jgi:transcriptional regulator with XRE-family HTH domain
MTPEADESCKPAITAREVLAVNLIRLRGQRQWSQEALAFEAGLHRTFVAHVERRVRNISLDNVERLAHALGLETYELLTPMWKR